MIDKITWQVVTIFGLVMAAVVCLSAFRADTTVILATIGLLAGTGAIGVTVSQLSGIKANVNGNLSKLVDLLEKNMDHLAQAQPIPIQDKPTMDAMYERQAP